MDIGGSGIKIAVFQRDRMSPVRRLPRPSLHPVEFADWLASLAGTDYGAIAVALPASIDPDTGRILHTFHPNWDAGVDLVSIIRHRFSVDRVCVLNDAEAHAFNERTDQRPHLQITLGSSVGIAVIDRDDRFVRTSRGGLDPGRLATGTSSKANTAMFALSGRGLAKLKRTNPYDSTSQYQRLLSEFALGLIVMFRPRMISLSGGIPARYPGLGEQLMQGLLTIMPKWYEPNFGMPHIRVAANSANAALYGAARWTLSNVVASEVDRE